MTNEQKIIRTFIDEIRHELNEKENAIIECVKNDLRDYLSTYSGRIDKEKLIRNIEESKIQIDMISMVFADITDIYENKFPDKEAEQ